MKKVSPELFDEMKSSACYIVTGWRVERTDGVVFGFTSGDLEFNYEELLYVPTNAFAGSAVVSKNNLSVDNMSATALFTAGFDETDLRAGLFDNAEVKAFWIRPDRPEWGVMPLRGGRFGEVTTKGLVFEVELRSAAQQLQQQFGDVYTLECRVQALGNSECKLQMDPETWAPGLAVIGKIAGEGGIGTVLKPTVDNGFWFVCDNAPSSIASNVARNSSVYSGANGAKLSARLSAINELHGLEEVG